VSPAIVKARFFNWSSCYSKSTPSPSASFTIKSPFLGVFTVVMCPCAFRWLYSTYMFLRCVTLLFPISNDPNILSIPHFHLMSRTYPAFTSSNFQLIFDNALEAYKKRTKKDLLTHPLAAQLQDCRCPSSILDVLHQQVEELNQSRNERWTMWLDPTVNVLYAFSETLGDVTQVCLSS